MFLSYLFGEDKFAHVKQQENCVRWEERKTYPGSCDTENKQDTISGKSKITPNLGNFRAEGEKSLVSKDR